jgi:hypothetical protein
MGDFVISISISYEFPLSSLTILSSAFSGALPGFKLINAMLEEDILLQGQYRSLKPSEKLYFFSALLSNSNVCDVFINCNTNLLT